MYVSVIFNFFIEFSHHHSPSLEQFHQPKKKTEPLTVLSIFHSLIQPTFFLSLQICLLCLHVNGTIQYTWPILILPQDKNQFSFLSELRHIKVICPRAATTVLQLLRPVHPGAHAPQQEGSLQLPAHAPQLESGPHSLQLRGGSHVAKKIQGSRK